MVGSVEALAIYRIRGELEDRRFADRCVSEPVMGCCVWLPFRLSCIGSAMGKDKSSVRQGTA